jgi:hypothetical protein
MEHPWRIAGKRHPQPASEGKEIGRRQAIINLADSNMHVVEHAKTWRAQAESSQPAPHSVAMWHYSDIPRDHIQQARALTTRGGTRARHPTCGVESDHSGLRVQTLSRTGFPRIRIIEHTKSEMSLKSPWGDVNSPRTALIPFFFSPPVGRPVGQSNFQPFGYVVTVSPADLRSDNTKHAPGFTLRSISNVAPICRANRRLSARPNPIPGAE